MNIISTVLLQAPGAAPGTGGSMNMSILLIVAMIAIFYFFMIRPQQKRQKEIQKAREAMKAGDKVVTAGGIHGKIKEVGDTSMLIEIAEGVRIRVDKASVFASTSDIQQKS
ncbi:MAG: preprotein translocase subunit YajC [Tannerella sp.]|jgi:preprotein translocase subunit YajC|nr:preprotein translocase subunit YajC [Tannerella sp.]